MRIDMKRLSFTAAAIVALILQAAAEDPSGVCNGVECGLGTCEASPDRVFGFVCECVPGWGQLRVNQPDDPFRFLPCILPNCTLDYSCYNDSMHKSAPSIPAPYNFSIFNPCLWSYCGAGECVRLPGLKHRCDCKKGFTNILNITSFPCFKDCAVGADCPNLGFQLLNGSFPPTPTNFYSGAQVACSVNNLVWLFVWAASIAMIQGTRMEF